MIFFSSCLRLSAHAYGSVMLIEIMSYPMPRKSLIYWSETMPLHPLFICLIHYENILVLFQRLLKNARVTVPCFQNIRTQYYFSVCLCLSFTFSFNQILHFWYMVNWISSVWSFFWCRGIHDYPPLTIKSIPCECSSLGGWNVDCNVRKMLQQWYATKTEDRDSCRIYHVESVNKEQVVTFNYCESGQILQNHHWRISPICLSI